MITLVLTSAGLGIAGIDPVGALLLISAIAAGVSRFKIKLFTVAVFISTILTGVLLSVLGTGLIDRIKMSIPNANSSVWAYVYIAIAIIITIWLISRARRKPNEVDKKPSKIIQGSSVTILIAAILFGVSSVLDPTFLANISFAAQTKDIVSILVMHTVWISISQVMLFGLFIAYLIGKHEKLIQKSKIVWHRHRTMLNRIVFGAGVGAVLLLVADSLGFLLRGDYFLI